MKRWICAIALLAAAGLLIRLPHPAEDIGKLEPVSLVQITASESEIRLRTDTGAVGSGGTLREAVVDLKSGASGSVFLDTADYLLFSGEMGGYLTEIYKVFRPACWICRTQGEPDLAAAAEYLSIHSPKLTLGKLRAGGGPLEELRMEEGRGTLEKQ